MAYLRKKEKLEHLLKIIKKGNCGDADCLARRMGVSVRTIKTYISILRQRGMILFSIKPQKPTWQSAMKEV